MGQGFGEWSNIRLFRPLLSAVYKFIGNGSYHNATNWENNNTPPNPVSSGIEVTILSSNNSECIIDQPVTFSKGSKLTLGTDCKLRLAQNLFVQ